VISGEYVPYARPSRVGRQAARSRAWAPMMKSVRRGSPRRRPDSLRNCTRTGSRSFGRDPGPVALPAVRPVAERRGRCVPAVAADGPEQ